MSQHLTLWIALATAAGAAATACEKEGPLETVPAEVLGKRAIPPPRGPLAAGDAAPAPGADASAPEIVSSYVLDGKRIEGETQIIPTEKVKKEMALASIEKIVPTVKMCLDERGEVSHLQVLSSSGFRTYDQQILGAMSQWRYEPHQVAGEPRPICTTIQFVYEQTDPRVADPRAPRE